jgi:hypothetical protein
VSLPVVGRGQPGDPPEVPECHGHNTAPFGCLQCDGSHRHEWVECWLQTFRGLVSVNRCVFCGARKCDMDCIERRHHVGPHISPDGKLRMVGK